MIGLRHIGLLGVFALATPAIAQVTGALPPPPVLKRTVTVTGELVRIGDLVENAGAKADVPVFRAPDLGHTGTVQTYRVLDALRAHGLRTVETHNIAEVVVTRASRVITLTQIEAEIARALAARYGLGEPTNLLVTLDRDARPIHLEATATGELKFERLAYDPRSGRFDVTFDLPDGAGRRRLPLRYFGTAVETVETAVLRRPLQRGEVVQGTDLLVERRPRSELDPDITGTVDVVGLAARRALRPGQPLRRSDLMRPELVHRNDWVTLVYESPGMVITARGKALEAGGEGDVVSVLNVQSKRTVQGTVSGPGRVHVGGLVTPGIPASVAAEPAGGPSPSE
jgi:flagella basal body P-ring formation protein FlgA